MKSSFFLLIVLLGFFACEKPLPQKPKVISTHTYFDSTKISEIESLKIDSLEITLDSISF